MNEKRSDKLQAYLDKRGITEEQMQEARERTEAAIEKYASYEGADELMRYLIGEGYEGDELLKKYEEVKPKFEEFAKKILEAEKALEEGRTTTYEAIRKNIKDKYGL